MVEIRIAKRPGQGQYRLYEAAEEGETAHWIPVTAHDLLEIANYALRHRQELLQEAASQDDDKDRQASLFISPGLREILEEGSEE